MGQSLDFTASDLTQRISASVISDDEQEIVRTLLIADMEMDNHLSLSQRTELHIQWLMETKKMSRQNAAHLVKEVFRR